MRVFTLGQTVTWGLTVTSDGTTLADLGGGNPTATVTLPDGTTALASVVRESLGKYAALLTSTQAGRHRIAWTGSGDNSGDLPYTDVADVWPADPRMIIGLDTARAALNVPASTRVNDDELRSYLVAATIVCESLIGPILSASVVEKHDGGRSGINLWVDPASITSVVEDGVTLAASGYCLGNGAILWRGAYPGAGTWTPGARNVVVTMAVGSAVIGENVRLGAAHLVAHWWRQTQQSGRPMLGMSAPDVPSTMVAGYAVPNLVVDLLKPSDRRLPGMA